MIRWEKLIEGQRELFFAMIKRNLRRIPLVNGRPKYFKSLRESNRMAEVEVAAADRISRHSRWECLFVGQKRTVDIAAQIVNNPLCTPAPGGAILYPHEP
jgi:hypothetical protein